MEEELKKLVIAWREYAEGHYCKTYDAGMGRGLHSAANALEVVLNKYAAQPLRAVDGGDAGELEGDGE